jgi:GR25 family glycosyltransferase involved in LPS biosynthesis
MSRFTYSVVHNPALRDRRTVLETAFRQAARPVEFIEIENSNPDLPEMLYGGSHAEWERKCEGLYQPPPPFRKLSHGERANGASHLLAICRVTQANMDPGADWGVILEDDAVFGDDFFTEAERTLSQLGPRVDCAFLGGGYPSEAVSATLATQERLHFKLHPATNTAVAYALRPSLAARIRRHARGFDLPIDFELAYLLMACNALVVHVVPFLVAEGSKTGRYASTLDPVRHGTR